MEQLNRLTRPEIEFFDKLREGKFCLQRSKATGAVHFYPRVASPGSGDTDLEWFEASGLGVVYATTVVRQRPPAQAYNVAVIDLNEGPRILSSVVDVPPEDVEIGAKVKAFVGLHNAEPAVLFRLCQERT